LLLTLAACTVDAGGSGIRDGSGPEGTGTDTAESSGATEGPTTEGTEMGEEEETGGGPKYDVGTDLDFGPAADRCTVPADELDAVGDCEEQAPADSFEPAVEWTWNLGGVVHTPLVANLTDDNDDGSIDLCDVPDVVAIATGGSMYAIDGETGDTHFAFDGEYNIFGNPALGDIDGDGYVEVVALSAQGMQQAHRVVALEHDGSIKWQASVAWDTIGYPVSLYASVALGDIDNDGDVEIVVGNALLDHTGQVIEDQLIHAAGSTWSSTTLADLDGDETLEIVLGHAAVRHDGTSYYDTGLAGGSPAVADLDLDGLPEILLANDDGLALIEHDGTVTWSNLRPTGIAAGNVAWDRPPTVHDMDGDGVPNFATASGNVYAVYEPDGSTKWTAQVSDQSGVTGSTAFDFLGDGTAEAMYTDEDNLFVFDGGDGLVELQANRTSTTLTEYSAVADVDNDGSAEIIVPSQTNAPGLQVIGDADDRWIQARRIWNQHTYHVTNVREDGTIPAVEPPNWESLNTFRTNSQIEGGGVCKPPPPG
jgi:outer membrane protein assembly factor BamB